MVAASIALAAFVASYQKQLQAQQAAAQQRSLESLKVLNLAEVHPLPNSTALANFSFLLASEFVNPSTISSFSVNGNPLRFFAVTPLAPNAGPTNCSYNSTTPLVLAPFEEVEITVNTDPGSGGACPVLLLLDLLLPHR